MSFAFRLLRYYGETDGGSGSAALPSVVFEDSTSPGLVALWEAAGVYDALYNSDGREAREISRRVAYGVDRLHHDASLGRLIPSTTSLAEAVRFLENVHRGCTVHPSAHVETQ